MLEKEQLPSPGQSFIIGNKYIIYKDQAGKIFRYRLIQDKHDLIECVKTPFTIEYI